MLSEIIFDHSLTIYSIERKKIMNRNEFYYNYFILFLFYYNFLQLAL